MSQNDAFYIVQLQIIIIDLLNVQRNVPLTRGSLAIAEFLVIIFYNLIDNRLIFH